MDLVRALTVSNPVIRFRDSPKNSRIDVLEILAGRLAELQEARKFAARRGLQNEIADVMADVIRLGGQIDSFGYVIP